MHSHSDSNFHIPSFMVGVFTTVITYNITPVVSSYLYDKINNIRRMQQHSRFHLAKTSVFSKWNDFKHYVASRIEASSKMQIPIFPTKCSSLLFAKYCEPEMFPEETLDQDIQCGCQPCIYENCNCMEVRFESEDDEHADNLCSPQETECEYRNLAYIFGKNVVHLPMETDTQKQKKS